MRERVIEAVLAEKAIAILRGVDRKDIVRTAEALYNGGFRLLEITFDRKGEVSAEYTCDCISEVAGRFGGRMFVGAGTVTTVRDVEMAGRAGASFLISPHTQADIIRRTVELGMVSIPGALTPTEIVAAHTAGADFVKLFPAGNMGAGYVRAVCAPLSDIRLLAVGGINADNAGEYLRAGCCGIGVGGNLANRTWIREGRFDLIEKAARELVAALNVREEKG